LIPKSVFDNSVFEGMKTDDHRASADLQPVGQRDREELLEVLELVVDGNSQGLKDTRGRVNLVMSLWAARKALGDRGDEIGGRPLREFGPPRDDCPGNCSARAFFSESLKKVGQFSLAERRQKIGRGLSCRGVKPHVEEPAALAATLSSTLDAETPRRVGQLIGGKSQVEQHAVDPTDSERLEDLG
jgi:hypothetical protein